MKIHALCLVNNEADIIDEGLAAALPWADAIYVLDNGSTDGTWEKVNALAKVHPAIVPWKHEKAPFSDGLRKDIYQAFVHRATEGDWWARLDPDEFYIDDPLEFLHSVPKKDVCVWYAPLSYYFTTEEARRYRENPSQFADSVPIHEKCRHYFNHWSEPRFVRHEAMDPWTKDEGWPEGLSMRGLVHPRRIRCRHFAYRSPSQIERRLATRKASSSASGAFSHEAIENWSASVDPRAIRKHRWAQVTYVGDSASLDTSWESRVLDAKALVFDAHDGRFQFNEELMPPIFPRPWWERMRYNRITNKFAPRKTVW